MTFARSIVHGALVVAASMVATGAAAAQKTSPFSDHLIALYRLIETEHLSPPPGAELVDSTLTKARQLAADNKPDFETCITEPVPKSLDANIFVLGIIPICLGLAEAAPEKAEADFAELAQAMISATKHSQELYIGPAHFENAKAFRASVGLSLRKDDRGIIVVGANASAPAGRGGIKKGDRLIAVNETLVSDFTLDDTVELLRGEAGSSVKLTFADGNGH